MMMTENIIDKIKVCKSLEELYELYYDVVNDKVNFIKNMKALINKRNELKPKPTWKGKI